MSSSPSPSLSIPSLLASLGKLYRKLVLYEEDRNMIQNNTKCILSEMENEPDGEQTLHDLLAKNEREITVLDQKIAALVADKKEIEDQIILYTIPSACLCVGCKVGSGFIAQSL